MAIERKRDKKMNILEVGKARYSKFLKYNLIKDSVFTQEIPQKNLIYLGFLTNIIGIALIFLIRSKYLPPEVPLYYGLPEGEAQIVPSLNLVFPFVFSLIIISINSLITLFIRDDFLKKTLVIGGLVATFFSVITIIKIIFLVGSY
ncbi:hypothetical protein A2W13_01400 [Candidatus Woesebacteria bacterium RBG_16_36_11]|uniref:DUF1648 domain-containing protein n=3 Tax=Candidatus Woeseibacteriota TaxID=1752722 RepID=A0A1F7XB90_9BACT|nr:MAG: hypothetical protein A2Z67_03405 [Candidatus Woesebacteria bacterium RBG_13_36_22]OGM12282.1 MAG: hypothetical protein A2W13_01400 [Candidatus Woesebacteria bacterium RBG_16_36_11]OGM16300.1 MAG: hypothetical protein A2V55_01115 [Candidatus Woesebacteria bacterium RBG_19FT_COMBO_37_29]